MAFTKVIEIGSYQETGLKAVLFVNTLMQSKRFGFELSQKVDLELKSKQLRHDPV